MFFLILLAYKFTNCIQLNCLKYMNGIYIITGGNVGRRSDYLREAASRIEDRCGNIVASSSVYESAAWGKTDQASFLNQVLEIESFMKPLELLRACLDIEKTMGRVRNIKWDSRIIDIDILFYGQEIVIEDSLIIPHPHLHARRFALLPMLELVPYFYHPVIEKTIETLALECQDELDVKLWDGMEG